MYGKCSKKTIKHDRHLYSFACLELGIVLMGQEMFDECQQRLLEARQSIKKEDGKFFSYISNELRKFVYF